MNLTMKNDKLFSIYPRGQYRLRVNLSDGNNKEMFQVAFEIDLTEWVKNCPETKHNLN